MANRDVHADNVGDQRAAGVGNDLTKNRSTAAPLHPIVLHLLIDQ